MQVQALRLRGALGRYWRRIAVGAFCGWLLSSVLGAFTIVWLEWMTVVSSDEAAALLGAAFVWSGTALGGVLAYAARPQRDTTASA
jgi:hypothetical protein